jgi:hypothetical protein
MHVTSHFDNGAILTLAATDNPLYIFTRQAYRRRTIHFQLRLNYGEPHFALQPFALQRLALQPSALQP